MTLLTDPRLLRAIPIAKGGLVRKLRRHVWLVPSATHGGTYLTDFAPEVPTCTCLDFETRGGAPGFFCKHLYAVQIRRRLITIPSGLMNPEEKRPSYKQDWPAYNAAQEFEEHHVRRLLKALCGGLINPPQGRGRPRLPLADVIFGCVMKVYSTLSARRAATKVRECQEGGFIDAAPHYNTVARYLEDEALTPILRALVLESASPLSDIETVFAVDSTGFSTTVYTRWFDQKYGREKKEHAWVKAHVICGVYTHVVTDVIVTDGTDGDAPELPELVERTSGRFEIDRVLADKAYLSRKNFAAIEKAGGLPYIPFKVGTTGKGPDLWRRMWAYYQYRHDDFMTIYHARSNVESVFSMMKRKFGAAVRSKLLVAQENEVLCKVIAHNLCVLVMSLYELGIHAEFWKSGTISTDSADT